MKTLAFLCLGLLLHLVHAKEEAFSFGFVQKDLCAVEGEEYTCCVAAMSGSAPSGGLTAFVNGTYAMGTSTISEPVYIPQGFNSSDDPICVTKVAVNNDCLDNGNFVQLTLSVADGPIAGVEVADDCDEALVKVFDDDVIEYEVSQDIFEVDEGSSSATVCVTLSCVDGPTKRCSPLLFHVDEVDGLAELQKKIALIPLQSENDDQVCCEVELEEGFDVPNGEFVDVNFTVKSEDLNVQGKMNAGTIRVNAVDTTTAPPCIPFFENDTPMVTGDDVLVDLDNCVETAQCELVGVRNTMTDCSGMNDNTGTLSTGRNSELTLSIRVTSPVSVNITRRFRMDGANNICDAHLVDRGITGSGTDFTLTFEGTGPGPSGDNTVTAFTCTVADGPSAAATELVAPAPCTSNVPYSFSIPDPVDCFYVIVIASDDDPLASSCSRIIRRPFKYPVDY